MRIHFLQSVYLKLQGNIPTFSSWLNGSKARSHQVQAGPSGKEGQSSSNSGIWPNARNISDCSSASKEWNHCHALGWTCSCTSFMSVNMTNNTGQQQWTVNHLLEDLLKILRILFWKNNFLQSIITKYIFLRA